MTKLDESIDAVEECLNLSINPTVADLRTIANAARAYAALLKLAPEIGALVEVGNAIPDGEILAHPKSTAELKKFTEVAANARPTLKAIHDNLTKWGE